jgi:hypothetical protein
VLAGVVEVVVVVSGVAAVLVVLVVEEVDSLGLHAVRPAATNRVAIKAIISRLDIQNSLVIG